MLTRYLSLGHQLVDLPLAFLFEAVEVHLVLGRVPDKMVQAHEEMELPRAAFRGGYVAVPAAAGHNEDQLAGL